MKECNIANTIQTRPQYYSAIIIKKEKKKEKKPLPFSPIQKFSQSLNPLLIHHWVIKYTTSTNTSAQLNDHQAKMIKTLPSKQNTHTHAHTRAHINKQEELYH